MHSFSHTTSPRQRFLPGLEALEDRCVPSSLGLLRLGTAVQSGASLAITANSPTSNKVVVLDDGRGDLTVTWNGGPSHFFSGVKDVTITVLGKADQVIWAQQGTLKESLNVQVNLKGTVSNFFEFGGADLAAGTTEQVTATGTGRGSDVMEMDTRGLGAGAEARLIAQGGIGVDVIDLHQGGGVGAGAVLALEGFTQGNSPQVNISVNSDVAKGANVFMNAVESGFASASSTSPGAISESYFGKNDGTVLMESVGGLGNVNIFSDVDVAAGSTGTTQDFESDFLSRGTDNFKLTATDGSSSTHDVFQVQGSKTAHNTATVTANVTVLNCQVVSVI
jgi:hypothetical protein